MLNWNCNTLVSCKELSHWKRPCCWEGLGAGGEGDNRGWDGWMASRTRWTWVWVNSGSWWWTGRTGVLWFMGSQRVGHDWVTELNWTEWLVMVSIFSCAYLVIWMSSLEDTNWYSLPLSLGISIERQDYRGREHWHCDWEEGSPPTTPEHDAGQLASLLSSHHLLYYLCFDYNIPSTYNFHLSFFFKKKWAKLLFIFGCAGSSLPHKLFSSCSAWGLLSSCSTCFSLQWLLLLQSTGSRAIGSVLVGLRLSCFEACGIFLDQGSNPCLLN